MSKILKGLNESAYRKYDNNRTGFSRGPRDDERHDLDVQQPSKQEWALKINGKVWSKDGKAVIFASKEQALKARQSLLNKRPELEVGLVTRGGVAEAGTGLDIDRSIPGRTIARVSDKAGKISSNANKLPSFNQHDDDYDSWSGKTSASIHDDEEDTFDTDYTGDEDGELNEISTDALAKYKTAAALDAGKADKEGDYKRADKRFSGIVKATKKQFANDEKNIAEDDLDENCWKGYHKEGNKELFGKTVPNCVKNTNEEQELEEYGDTAKGQKMLDKVHNRAANRVTSKQADKDPAYARKAQQTQDRAWDRLAVKEQGVAEEQHSCPHCGGEMVSEELMNEKKDTCYYKVKSRYKVWPSAYASGALVKCRKKGASNWGNGGKKNESSILEGIEQVDENLHQWFKEKWVRFGPDGKIRGDCARGDDSEGKPKCLPQSKAHSLGKKGRASAAARKRREDPNPERSGKAINVNTKKKANEEALDEKWSQKYKDSINCSNPKGFSQRAHCQGKNK